MRPESFGLLYVPRKRGAVASLGALCTSLSIRAVTARPATRLFSDVAASTSPSPPGPRPLPDSSSRNAAGRHYSPWPLAAASPTLSRLTAHRSLRQLSTASNLAKKSSRRKGRPRKPKIEPAERYRRQAKILGLEDGLSEEQRRVLHLVVNHGKSVFFTGPAGTGKSLLLRRIIEGLTTQHLEDSSSRIAVTASTGLAAFNIGGTTLHRFAGIGLGKAPTEMLISDIQKDKKFKLKRWKKVQVLIIDEISMIDSTLFDKLDTIARAVRKKDLPFGGIQLVITGDFFQLPPVLQGSDDGTPRFCFEAEAWKTAVPHTIGLTQIYRQSDPVFAGMLNEIREGRLSPTTIDTFKSLSRPLISPADNAPEPAELFPLRREADAANTRRMRNIKDHVNTYHAQDGGTVTDADTRKRLLADCIAPEILEIKETAQVMLIKNIDKTLVNGSLGRVVGFANQFTFSNGTWGLGGRDTVHGRLYPVVRFQLSNGDTKTELCEPAEWSVERWVPEPWSDTGWEVETLATRTQVPLILAWALSIHKSQGQTLELVKVDLNRVFERGQAYVALSRAKSMDGLQVLNFDPKRVTAHPKVKEFYASLSSG